MRGFKLSLNELGNEKVINDTGAAALQSMDCDREIPGALLIGAVPSCSPLLYSVNLRRRFARRLVAESTVHLTHELKGSNIPAAMSQFRDGTLLEMGNLQALVRRAESRVKMDDQDALVSQGGLQSCR